MTQGADYSYTASVKSDVSDELINTYVLRPVAGVIVRVLHRTPVTPNGVTIAAIVAGILAAGLYSRNTEFTTALAGLSLTLKDILDSADGQLARAKALYSRAGRFLDSLGDVFVNLLVFAAITFTLTTDPRIPFLGVLAFLGTTLRVSYHVFYQTSYLHLQNAYGTNRIAEDITPEDLRGNATTIRLQTLFVVVYGWQDRMMMRLDQWCSRTQPVGMKPDVWYRDRTSLRLSGFQGLGTELFVLTACSLCNALEVYLYVNVLLLNALWGLSVFYRRVILWRRVQQRGD